MIGQEIGLFFLGPRALDVIEQCPLAAGDFYPGDLLSSLMSVPVAFWALEVSEGGKAECRLFKASHLNQQFFERWGWRKPRKHSKTGP